MPDKIYLIGEKVKVRFKNLPNLVDGEIVGIYPTNIYFYDVRVFGKVYGYTARELNTWNAN